MLGCLHSDATHLVVCDCLGCSIYSVGRAKREEVMCTQLEEERERGSHAEAAAKTQLKEERERELGALS